MTGLRQTIENSDSASAALSIIERKTDEIEDALDIYDRFIDEELYKSEELPSEVNGYLQTSEIDHDNSIDAMIGLATEIAIESDELDNAFGHVADEKRRINLDYQEMWDEINDLRNTYQRARKSGVDEEDPYRKNVQEDIPEEASPGRIMHDREKENFEGELNFGADLLH